MTIPKGAVRKAADTFPTEVVILDAEGIIRYTNDAWQQYAREHGYEGDPEMLGVDYFEGINTRDADAPYVQQSVDGLQSLLDGQREAFSLEYACHGPNERRWFLLYASRFHHDEKLYLVANHIDITDRKIAERAVERQNQQLSTVASVLSHDIRNPLTVANGHLTLLAEQFEDEPESVEKIRSALSRIDAIIKDALFFAKQSNVEEYDSVELERVAAQAWDNVETADTTLAIDETLRFEANASILANLFENLFRNAVDHGGEHVTVTVGPLSERDGFYVEDDGPGIPPDRREQAFQTGYTTGADEGNTGLGLAIVEWITDAHDWDVTITEGEDGGARFEFTGVTTK